jgi:uncharacterized membrane protein YoaK (UPF0700 family)
VKPSQVTSLLSFNGGFVDTASFLGLQGLFAAHVTGNFVTLGAALVFGTHGVIAKLVALPEFAAMIALAHVVGRLLAKQPPRALRVLLGAEAVLLVAFFVLAVTLGPFADSDTPAALLTGFMGIGAMAVQNAVHRVHFGALPPSTIMTGNTTQAVLDAVDLLWGGSPEQAPVIRSRLGRLITALLYFAAGCAIAALLYAWLGFWCLAVPVIVGAATALTRIQA